MITTCVLYTHILGTSYVKKGRPRLAQKVQAMHGPSDSRSSMQRCVGWGSVGVGWGRLGSVGVGWGRLGSVGVGHMDILRYPFYDSMIL